MHPTLIRFVTWWRDIFVPHFDSTVSQMTQMALTPEFEWSLYGMTSVTFRVLLGLIILLAIVAFGLLVLALWMWSALVSSLSILIASLSTRLRTSGLATKILSYGGTTLTRIGCRVSSWRKTR